METTGKDIYVPIKKASGPQEPALKEEWVNPEREART